jgi:hypothetical protein
MFGGIPRLLAVGELSQRLSDYLKELATKYLVLSVAGMIFLAAIVFAILAVFWGLTSSTQNPVLSAAIMAVGLGLIGLLTVLGAYGIGRKQTRSGVREPLRPIQSRSLASAEDVGREIAHAARTYGPLRVTAAAAAGGLAAGMLASRLGLVNGADSSREPSLRRARPYGRQYRSRHV